jgi:hypothetical protein
MSRYLRAAHDDLTIDVVNKPRQIASNRAALAASKGERCKRCNACGNSPGSDTGSNSSLNSGSAATSSDYR